MPTYDQGVKFIAGAGIVVALRQYVSVKFGVDMIILDDKRLQIPLFIVMSLTLNLHPF